MSIDVEQRGHIRILTLNRSHAKNAVNSPTAEPLAQAFREYAAWQMSCAVAEYVLATESDFLGSITQPFWKRCWQQSRWAPFSCL